MTTTNCGLPLSNESNAASRDHINESVAHHTQRVVNHVQVMVQDPNGVEPQLEIIGLNAAKVYGIDPDATRCAVDCTPTARLKRRLDEELGPNRWMFQKPKGPATWDEFVAHSMDCVRLGRPG